MILAVVDERVLSLGIVYPSSAWSKTGPRASDSRNPSPVCRENIAPEERVHPKSATFADSYAWAMLIRPARATDFEAIAALTNFYIVHTAIHFGLEPVSPQELQDSWSETQAQFPFLVAEVEGVFAGYAKASTWRSRKAYDRTCESGIYIDAKFQGRGVGKAMYVVLLNECRQRGFHTVVAGAALPNDISCRLHESCGFALTGVFREVGFKFEKWHDVAWFQIML